jgi:hypothetical protein
VFSTSYDLWGSVAEYEAELRSELHEETPDPRPFLEDLAGGLFEASIDVEDRAPNEDEDNEALGLTPVAVAESKSKEHPVRAGSSSGYGAGVNRPPLQSALGKRAKGRAARGAPEIETPSMDWR